MDPMCKPNPLLSLWLGPVNAWLGAARNVWAPDAQLRWLQAWTELWQQGVRLWSMPWPPSASPRPEPAAMPGGAAAARMPPASPHIAPASPPAATEAAPVPVAERPGMAPASEEAVPRSVEEAAEAGPAEAPSRRPAPQRSATARRAGPRPRGKGTRPANAATEGPEAPDPQRGGAGARRRPRPPG